MDNLEIAQEANWIRNDILSTDLDDLVKSVLINLTDEQLVEIINNIEKNINNNSKLSQIIDICEM